jgi:hypothetical protein
MPPSGAHRPARVMSGPSCGGARRDRPERPHVRGRDAGCGATGHATSPSRETGRDPRIGPVPVPTRRRGSPPVPLQVGLTGARQRSTSPLGAVSLRHQRGLRAPPAAHPVPEETLPISLCSDHPMLRRAGVAILAVLIAAAMVSGNALLGHRAHMRPLPPWAWGRPRPSRSWPGLRSTAPVSRPCRATSVPARHDSDRLPAGPGQERLDPHRRRRRRPGTGGSDRRLQRCGGAHGGLHGDRRPRRADTASGGAPIGDLAHPDRDAHPRRPGRPERRVHPPGDHADDGVERHREPRSRCSGVHVFCRSVAR